MTDIAESKNDLIELLIKRFWFDLLGDMGELAQPALPTLEKIMTDYPARTRFEIEDAIRKIAPKRAAELGF